LEVFSITPIALFVGEGSPGENPETLPEGTPSKAGIVWTWYTTALLYLLMLELWTLRTKGIYLAPLFLILPFSLKAEPTPSLQPLTRGTFPAVVTDSLKRMEKILEDFSSLEEAVGNTFPDLKEAIVGVNHQSARKLYEYARELARASIDRSLTLKPQEILTSPAMIPEWRMLNTLLEQMIRLYRESYESFQRLRREESRGKTPATP